MSLLFQLFIVFAKLAAFAFGGGYVIISSLIMQSEAKGWATAGELTNVIVLAGMSPGPVAMNLAVAYGYKLASFPGAFASLLGIAVPCAIIVIIAARFFFSIYQHPIVKGALYTLRATITGIIIYAAYDLASKNGIIASKAQSIIENGINISLSGIQLLELKSVLLALASFMLLVKTKIHPIFIILGAGVVGILIFR